MLPIHLCCSIFVCYLYSSFRQFNLLTDHSTLNTLSQSSPFPLQSIKPFFLLPHISRFGYFPSVSSSVCIPYFVQSDFLTKLKIRKTYFHHHSSPSLLELIIQTSFWFHLSPGLCYLHPILPGPSTTYSLFSLHPDSLTSQLSIPPPFHYPSSLRISLSSITWINYVIKKK